MKHLEFMLCHVHFYLNPGLGLMCFLCAGVLLCRGNRLLTGSDTHWLRLWEVEAVQSSKSKGKVCSEDGYENSFLCVFQRNTNFMMTIKSLFFFNYCMKCVGHPVSVPGGECV